MPSRSIRARRFGEAAAPRLSFAARRSIEPASKPGSGAWVRAAVVSCLLFAAGIVAAQTLAIGRASNLSLLADIGEAVMREAFERAGLGLEVRPYPLLRSIEMANDGEIDGDLMRIADVAKAYPNLIALATPITRVEVAAYGIAPDFARRTPAEIRKMRVGITRGTFVLAKYTRAMAVTDAFTPLVTRDMLVEGRIDAAILVYVDAESDFGAGDAGASLVRWPYLWAAEPLYFYLNRKHAALVPRLDAALARMQREGLIERLYADALRRRHIPPLKPAPGE